ncbi:hypothetical protein [Paenibacillus thermotolerans]|uniref:hypothetical protein n=1 Tax=Paenibacillus thermotolerans TaxID=3027807 RepID=UPI002368827C|nr:MULTISPECIES: hypothetical protein [unclassified Paenibacillus]
MTKKIAGKVGVSVLACSLAMSMGTSVLAAPKSTDAPITGRTEQNRATGMITSNPVPTLAHYATNVTLTGTVVIDGPQLVLLINGTDVSANAKLTKVADKTWTYEYNTSVDGLKGDVSYSIDAYTVYVNGKTAGEIHTRAANAVSQKVHVPYIVSYDYVNLNWTTYDRVSNLFTFSYNQVNVWDDGVREIAEAALTAQVEGTQTYTDPKSGKTITPPVYFRDFAFSSNPPVWTYNAPTYSVSFEVTKTWSNGDSKTETITLDGLIPGIANPISVTVDGVTHTASMIAPAAPVVAEPVITGLVVTDGVFVLRNNTGADYCDGFVKLAYTMSDGSTRKYSTEWIKVATWSDSNVRDKSTKTKTIDNYSVSLTFDPSKVVDQLP